MWIDELSDRDRVRVSYRYLEHLCGSYGPIGGATPYRDFADWLADRIRASLD
ncbi:MAG: hypothetical protein QOE76_1104 [Frankiales bacterium]|nr:hypothetical protein [Frankiales bacterium]